MSADQARGAGASWVLLGTAVGGGAGYLLSALAGPMLGAASYAPFAVFWSALYLIVTAASGIQQEIARSAHPKPTGAVDNATAPVARRFGILASLVAGLVIAVTGPFWLPLALGDRWAALLWPLVFGIASYVVVTVYAGVLYGLRLWRPIAALVMIDGLLRLVLVVGAMLATDDLTMIAWAVVIPFLAAPLMQWPFVRRAVVGRFTLDAGPGRLAGNAARTVLGAAATGVLVSGFPLLLGASTGGADDRQLAAVIFAVMLTRAPIVVVVLALQSYLVVRFKSHVESSGVDSVRIVGVVFVIAAVVSLLLLLWGEGVLGVVFGADFVLPGPLLAGIVGSSAAIGALCVTGSLVLARARHSLFTTGWVVAAVATVVMLFLVPLTLEWRALAGLWIGPVIGFSVHVFGLRWTSSR